MTPPDQRADLRSKYRKQTTRTIIEAYVALVEERGTDNIALSEVASKAEVSERTLHRHFQSRIDLFAAVGDHINAEIFPAIGVPDIRHLSAVYRQVVDLYEQRPNLATLLARSSAIRPMRAGFRAVIQDRIADLLEAEYPDAAPSIKRRALAGLTYLDNVSTWTTLRDEFAMDGDEIAETVGWLMELILNEVDRGSASNFHPDHI